MNGTLAHVLNADLNFEVELLAIGDTKAPGFTGGSSGGGCVIC